MVRKTQLLRAFTRLTPQKQDWYSLSGSSNDVSICLNVCKNRELVTSWTQQREDDDNKIKFSRLGEEEFGVAPFPEGELDFRVVFEEALGLGYVRGLVVAGVDATTDGVDELCLAAFSGAEDGNVDMALRGFGLLAAGNEVEWVLVVVWYVRHDSREGEFQRRGSSKGWKRMNLVEGLIEIVGVEDCNSIMEHSSHLKLKVPVAREAC